MCDPRGATTNDRDDGGSHGCGCTSNGSVRDYRRQTHGSYALSTTINGPVASEGFGYRMAMNEHATVLVIGAPNAGTAANSNSGKAY